MKTIKNPLPVLVPLVIPVILLAILAYGSASIDRNASDDAAVRLESSLRRAIAAEYAVTGCYPESLSQITTKYSIQTDEDRFLVFYTPVAENIPPDLTVIDLTTQNN